MPRSSSSKLSEVISDTKRCLIPALNQRLMHHVGDSRYTYSGSILHPDASMLPQNAVIESVIRPSIAFFDKEPIDAAIEIQDYLAGVDNLRPNCVVVNMANANKAGGDWETVTHGPEETFARRSNLSVALRTVVRTMDIADDHYPIPEEGGLYTPCVWILREGAPHHKAYDPRTYRSVPVISVTPVRRPKLDSKKESYAFEVEKDMMKERMRNVLRIAAFHGYHDICLGYFGLGSVWRNPAMEVAEMWKDLLYFEFEGFFRHVAFAFPEGGRDKEIFESVLSSSSTSRLKRR